MFRSIYKGFLVLGLLFLSTLFVAQFSHASAAEYYVAGDTGLDTNTGSSSQPWKTIQKAASLMVAGDIVNVKGGIVYSDSSCANAVICPTNAGTIGSPITYRAWAGTGFPIIDGPTSNLYLATRQFININSFHFRNGVVWAMGGTSIMNSVFEKAELRLSSHINTSSSYIINNTFDGRDNSIMTGISAGQRANRVYIYNNIVTNYMIGLSSDNGNYVPTHDNNLYFNNSGIAGWEEWGTDYMEANNIFPAPNDIHADPLFYDAANGDFRLLPNSPAINAGADLTSNGITVDIIGRLRPNAGTFDIGAFEDPNIYVAGDVVSSGDGSKEAPFKVLQEAADATTPGDVVNIKGNFVYSAYTPSATSECYRDVLICINNFGTPTNKITYQAWVGTGVPILAAGSPAVMGVVVTDLYSFSGDLVIRNLVFRDFRVAIYLADAYGSNIEIYNNTVYGGSTGINLGNDSTTNVVVKNNIIANNARYGLAINNLGTGYVADNNLLWNNLVSNYGPGVTPGVNDIYADPLFLSPTDNNFKLAPSSPAINNGVLLSSVTVDLLGVPRPQGAGYDIGAFEYYSIPVAITSPTSTYVTTTSVTITGSATTTTTAGITDVEYSLDNGAWTSAMGNFPFTLDNLTQGSHTVRVRATDSYGNQTHESEYATKTFTVDSITPSILLTKLGKITDLPDKTELTYYFTSQTPKIEGVTEANSTVTFMVGAETYTAQADSNGNFVITLGEPKLVRGENLMTYFSTDLAGNISETRTLKLVIGEEYFPAWIYEKVVIEGQDIDEVDQDGDTDEEPVVPTEVYKILFTDKDGNPLADTRVEIDGRFYITDADGFIYVTDLEPGTVTYKVKDLSGTLEFDPVKEINEVIVEIPNTDKNPDKTDNEKDSFNWLWIIVPMILLGAFLGYNYISGKSHEK